MSALERQEAMLKAVYISEADVKIEQASAVKSDIRNIPFTVKCEDSEITYSGSSVVTTSPDKKLTFTFSGRQNSETYIQIKNLHFKATPDYDLYFGSEEVDPLNLYSKTNWKLLSQNERHKIKKDKMFHEDPSTVQLDFYSSISEGKKKFEHHTPDDTFAFGKTDYLVNIGYSETAANTIEINFPVQGVYSFDSVSISCVPMDDYTSKVDALRADSLQNVKFGTNKVEGTLSASADKVLCVAIPYSEGWSAYVDGEETPVFKANEQYIGLNVSQGEHTVELHYSRPWKNLGFASTALGIVLLPVYILFEKRRTKKQK
ncbi:MAG: YfhO family protein, partial [Clostridia bacterium]|nr:YfhO family protein [Clostridia bacterium]